jgi:hypothetical protein
MKPTERPSYPRILAPIVQRPTTRHAQGLPGRGLAHGAGGVRTYSDDPRPVDALLEIDIFLDAEATASAVVEVEWCDKVPFASPARFDIGLRIHRLSLGDRVPLEAVLAPATSAPAPWPVDTERAAPWVRVLREGGARILRARDEFLAALRLSVNAGGALPDVGRYLATPPRSPGR